MERQAKIVRSAILILAAVFIGTSLAALRVWVKMKSQREFPVLGTAPDFLLTERSGRPFGREQLIGKISVLDFFFTRCPAVCPVMNGNMADLYRDFAGAGEVQFVSITVDPDFDTLGALHQYALNMGVTDNRWVFLRGPVEEVVRLSERGFLLPADRLPAGHSAKFVLLDRRARIRGYYSGLDRNDMTILKKHIRQLLLTR
jgi:protein SCO1/2